MKKEARPPSYLQTFVTLCAILVVGFYLRIPFLSNGLPYLYDEDEAHHVNRVIEMVKTGDLNPHYFHKPSLHFYLRIPVVTLALQWEQWRGRIASFDEVRTRDQFGLADYAFAASHPIIIKAARSVSLLASLGTIILTFLITRRLLRSRRCGLLAALFVGISPALVEYSALVNVDTLMAFFCLLSAHLALRLTDSFSIGKLILTAIAAGLAVATKYNAAPVATLPLIATILAQQLNWRRFIYATTVPVLTFFAVCPYSLVEVDLFWKHVDYEVWHYAVAGHVGNEGKPGLSQLFFYARWISFNAMGVLFAVGAALGLLGYLRIPQRRTFIVLAFPALYLALMIAQKVNFPRNMLVMIPFAAIFCSSLLRGALEKRSIFWLALPILVLAEPVVKAMELRSNAANRHDTRLTAAAWITANRPGLTEVALAGQLQFAPQLRVLPAISAIEMSELNPHDLYQQGYDWLVLRAATPPPPNTEQIYSIDGARTLGRVVDSPAISVYRFIRNDSVIEQLSAIAPTITLPLRPEQTRPECARGGEDFCWLSQRYTKIVVDAANEVQNRFPFRTISLEVMTPWEGQQVTLYSGASKRTESLTPGSWQRIATDLRVNQLSTSVTVGLELSIIHAPRELGMSGDPRRLGVAVRQVVVNE